MKSNLAFAGVFVVVLIGVFVFVWVVALHKGEQKIEAQIIHDTLTVRDTVHEKIPVTIVVPGETIRVRDTVPIDHYMTVQCPPDTVHDTVTTAVVMTKEVPAEQLPPSVIESPAGEKFWRGLFVGGRISSGWEQDFFGGRKAVSAGASVHIGKMDMDIVPVEFEQNQHPAYSIAGRYYW